VAVHGGPKASPDGLVLALDGANFKSFKGEATTNEIVVVTWAGDGSNQASFVKESVLITDENLKYKGYETYLWSPGTSNNCYLNGADLSTSRTSTVWTFSCYVKRQDGAPITSLNVYMYYPTSDGSAAGTIQDVGNGWYRVSRTRTGTDNYLSLIGFTGFVTGHKYYLSGAQLEKKSYPTTFVATNTTRGTTVATGGGWADLTGKGNNGELINGVRENSDNGGSLVFDGVDDYVDTNQKFNFDQSSQFSAEFWIKFISHADRAAAAADIFGKGHFYNNNWSIWLWNDHRINFETAGNPTRQGSVYLNTSPLALNTWHHYTATYSNGLKSAYVNGILIGTQSYAGPGNFTNTNNALIGRRPGDASRSLRGNISSIKLYSRALAASEVQQNFIATKSRFGL
jgi:hypothetical protein